MINHRQSATAFVCCLSEGNNLAFGVHRPMLPSSIKIVRKLVELTEQYLLIMLSGYCQHSGKCHKKSEAIAQTLVFYTIRATEKEKENEGLGTRDWVLELNGYIKFGLFGVMDRTIGFCILSRQITTSLVFLVAVAVRAITRT